NNYIMFSDSINFWETAKKIQEPLYLWELIKIGNSGSPLETEKGWLLITHGVGPMRSYSLGTVLLDKEDPTKVIGRLKEPILIPNEEERDGYVPNVVYSCGSIIHNNELIIAYGMADYASGFVGIPLDELLEKLTNH
ncbi:MAG: glycosidase, partial [Candidatus Aminicenantes bacterium]|nr:glycosidase [Candidatus Aminicenantes bacterium]